MNLVDATAPLGMSAITTQVPSLVSRPDAPGFLWGKRKEPTPLGSALFGCDVRRCPTLPRGLPRSTIGAEGLNFRVRDGTGCFPLAMAAATLWNYQPDGSRPYSGNRIVDASPPITRGIHVMSVVCVKPSVC